MVNFKRRTAEDIAAQEKEPPPKRMKHQISDSTTSTNQTSEGTKAAGPSPTNDGDANDIELVRPKTQFKNWLDKRFVHALRADIPKIGKHSFIG